MKLDIEEMDVGELAFKIIEQLEEGLQFHCLVNLLS